MNKHLHSAFYFVFYNNFAFYNKVKVFQKTLTHSLLLFLFILPACLLSQQVCARTFQLQDNVSVIGKVQFDQANDEDTTVTVAQRYNLGLNSIIDANPGLPEVSYIAEGRPLTIATRFILPPLPHRGIVINLPEMRMYYYPDSTTVMTFPIGIGKVGKTIPIVTTEVVRKAVNPTWVPTQSIRQFNRDQGIELPYAMGPGPDNPLGPYAIYMRVPTYLIHSTIFPESIGRRASFGCIRMYENDIREFFPLVKRGTPVAIVNIPVKVGWNHNRLFVQIYPTLIEHKPVPLNSVVNEIRHIAGDGSMVNWQLVAYLANHPDGIPHEIGFAMSS